MHKHNLTLPSNSFVLKSEADGLHARMTLGFTITLLFINMLGPEANIAMITVNRTHAAIDNHPLFAVRAFESTRIMLSLPFLFFFLLIIRILIAISHKNLTSQKNQPRWLVTG